MAGKIRAALVLGTLLAGGPALLEAQNGSRPATSPEAEVFMGTLETIREHHVSALADSALWERAIAGLIQALDDPYATVFTPDEFAEFREQTTGDYAGIGVQIGGLDGGITITSVFRDTPAEAAGLLVGDKIVGVNGESTEGWSTSDASDVIRGTPGTRVTVSIDRDGMADPVPFRIERANVHVTAVRSGMIGEDVGYIHLERVARGSAQEIDDALGALDAAQSLVIDLRRNPGGYMDESLRLSDLFLERGLPLATVKSRAANTPTGEIEESYRGRIPARVGDKPIVILVDRFTASAAEIVAGALQDHDRALVLGERTFGKGVVQTLLPLPAGRQIRLTTGAWYSPLGRSLHRHRTSAGELVPQDADTLPVYSTKAGRQVKGGGGIFPDLDVADDTLTLNERALLNAAAEAEVPLGLRLAEFSLDVAKDAIQVGGDPDIPPARFDAFIDALLAEGVPQEAMDATGVRNYLDWRARMGAAERVKDFGRAAMVRMERDPVLTEAVELLRTAASQAELFAAAELRAEDAARLGARPSAGR